MSNLLPAGLTFRPGFSPDPQVTPGDTAPSTPAGNPQNNAETATTGDTSGAGGKKAQPDPCGGTGMIVPLLAFGAFLYFFMIRPQQKQTRERKTMMAALKKNDKVVTTSGIFATVVALDEKTVTLKIDEKGDVRVRFDRNAITTILNKEEG